MELKYLFIFLITLVSISVVFGCSIYLLKETIVNQKELFENNCKKEENMLDSDIKLIFYWAEWCGVCKQVKPLWEVTKKDIKEKYPEIIIEEINCENPNLCYFLNNGKKSMIEGVPTILLRKNNTDKEYKPDPSNNIICDKTTDDLSKFLDLYLEK